VTLGPCVHGKRLLPAQRSPPWHADHHDPIPAAHFSLSAALLAGVRDALGDSWLSILAGGLAGTAVYSMLTFVNSGYSAAELRLFGKMLLDRLQTHRVVRAVLGSLLLRAPAWS